MYDPLVQDMSKDVSLDLEYLEILMAIENRVETKDLPMGFELRKLTGYRDTLFVVEIAGSHRLILKDGEILVPKSLRDKMMSNLHITQSSDGIKELWIKKKFWVKKKLMKFRSSLDVIFMQHRCNPDATQM